MVTNYLLGLFSRTVLQQGGVAVMWELESCQDNFPRARVKRDIIKGVIW